MNKKKDRRVSVGETLGVSTPDPEGTNLAEAKALDTAAAAARRLNSMSADSKRKKKKGRANRKRRSSVALMEATAGLFESTSDEEKERDADGDVIPDLVSVSGSEESSTDPSSSSSEDEEEHGESYNDSREVKEDREAPETGKPEEPATAAPEPPAEKPSRTEIAPTPSAGAEAAPAHEGTDSPSPEATLIPTIEPVISLVTTTTSDSAGEGAVLATPGGKGPDTSVIETPDRPPEVPDTGDRQFIKPDEEGSSTGDDRESDPDYEPTDPTEGGTSTPDLDLGCADGPPPGFGDHSTEATRATAEENPEEVEAQLEAIKAQRAQEAQERLDREVQKRADEMFARRLVMEEVKKQKRDEKAATEASTTTKRSKAKKDKSATIEEYARKRRKELEAATARAVAERAARRKTAKKARKRTSQKERAADRRKQKAEEDAEFEKQLEAAKRASIEEVAASEEPKPEGLDESEGTDSHSEAEAAPAPKKKRRGYESDESNHKKQTKRARRARRRRTRRRKKKEKRKRRRHQRQRQRHKPKSRRKHRRDSSDDPSSSSSSSSETTSTSESTSSTDSTSHSTSGSSDSNEGYDGSSSDGGDEGTYRFVKPKKRKDKRVTVVYGGALEKDPKPPFLKHGDAASRAAFRLKYLKYVKTHELGQRTRPADYRTYPKAVVECIDPDLLWYACKYELPRKFRTSNPAKADALAVHNWVLTKNSSEMDADDEEGIKAIKALKCNLTGENGVKNVQELFIQVRRTRKRYRLRVSSKQIIYWLTSNISPPKVKRTIINIQKQEGRRGQKASKDLSYFHKILRRVARRFKVSHDLGLEEKPKTGGGDYGKGGGGKGGKNKDQDKADSPGGGDSSGNQRKGGGGRGNGGRGRGRGRGRCRGGGRGRGGGPSEKPIPDHVRCINCNGKHYVSSCPRLPREKKNWTFEQHLADKRKREASENKDSKDSADSRSGPGTSPGGNASNPGGKSTRSNKRAVSFAEPIAEEAPETETPKGKRAVSVSEGKTNDGEPKTQADGKAVVGKVEGFYTCDGGCDRATITEAYAKAIIDSGGKYTEYAEPLLATLANGETKPIIMGFMQTDVEVVTPAGKVILPEWHVDVLKGPTNEHLLYLGAKEETELKLKSFKDQLTEFARTQQGLKKKARLAKDGNTATATQVKIDGKLGKVVFEPGQQPRFKCRLSKPTVNPTFEPVTEDGKLFVGESGWQLQRGTKYVIDPMATESYVTTAAIAGREMKLEGKRGTVEVRAHDLETHVADWMGQHNPTYQHRVRAPLYVLPDDSHDYVRRLTVLPHVILRVVDSPVAAVVLGRPEHRSLLERLDEDLGAGENAESSEEEAVEHRLNEMLEAARLAGMSKKGLARARVLLKETFRHIWRLALRPTDVASVPPLEIKVKGDIFRLPRPYMRRYTPAEITWWKEKMAELVEAGIFRPTNEGYMSPSNLVKKVLNGEVLPDDFRMVIDLRALNKLIEELDFPLPKLDEVVHSLKGARCFASADNTKGYWQFPLAEASKRYTAFTCPVGSFEHNRVPMGLKVAAAHYQRTMNRILEEMLYTHILQYIDDTLLFAKNEEELLDSIERYFTLLARYNVKLHPSKFVLFETQLVWGGKLVTSEGTRPNPKRIETILSMEEPTDAAQLMNFVYGVAWFRSHMPYFAEIAAPLYDTINEALERYKKKTSVNAKKVPLDSLENWKTKGQKAFKDVKKALAESVTTTYFDPDKKVCIFGDACDGFWCLMLTQCEPGVERRPWDEQVGLHSLLALDSGRFRHAQLRWHTVDKEGYCFGVQLHNYTHWLLGSRHPAALFTDHRNLLAFFADEARPTTCTKPNRERLTRWGMQLAGLNYEIFHIRGEDNRLADLGSRWGNRFAGEKSKTGLRGGPKPLLLRVLQTKGPKTGPTVYKPDLDVTSRGLLPLNAETVTRKELRQVQDQYAASRPAALKLGRGSPQLWEDDQRRVWIPDQAVRMKRVLYALAHQGLAGHRGQKATMVNLTSRFVWTNMKTEAEAWRQDCLQCIKLFNGETIPRPLGSQLIAEYPGEVVSMDYIKLGATRTGYMYVLMLQDRLSRAIRFVPATSATAILAARCLLEWSAQRGLPKWLITDGGSHFQNEVLKELTAIMGIDHHITLAYCPWANGSVEIVGRDLLWTLRALTSEFRTSLDEWDLMTPMLEFVINHRIREVLGHRSALEVLTGRKPASTTTLAVWAGVKMNDMRKFVTSVEVVERHCARLDLTLSRLHEAVRSADEARLRRRAIKAAGRHPGQSFNVGDYVMLTAEKNQANPVRNHKVGMFWQGPYEVVGAVGPTKYEVKLLGDDKVVTVHWKVMRRLAGPEFSPDEEVIASALHDRQRFLVDRFVDWIIEEGEAELLVHWKHHGEEERTWEPLWQLLEDVPQMVKTYVSRIEDVNLTQALEDDIQVQEATGPPTRPDQA